MRLRSVATSLRTRLATALALVMLGPVVLAAIATAVVVPAQARTAAQEIAKRDASGAVLTITTRCQVIKDAAKVAAGKVQQYASLYPQLPVEVAQLTANGAVASHPGVTAAVLGPAGQVLAIAGASSGRVAVTAGGYGSSCSKGAAGRRPDLAALSETVPVSARRDGEIAHVGSVVFWQTVDDKLIHDLVIDIGSTGSLRVLPPSSHVRARYVADGKAYAGQPRRPGMPFALQAIQPVPDASVWPWLALALLAAALLALLLTRTIAGRLTQPLAELTSAADRLRNGDLSARSDVQDPVRGPQEVTDLARALDEMAAKLRITMDKHEEAQRLSVTDALTGAGNLRLLSGTMTHEVERATRFGRPFTVLMLDLDHFKDVNDSLGHQFGDAVLREFAQRMRTCLRELDTVARYGGEEFVLVLPETGLDGGCSAADRVIEAVRASPFRLNGVERSVTVSIGIASFPIHARSAADLLRCADQALYAAKSAGRDRWMVAAMSAGPAASVPQAG